MLRDEVGTKGFPKGDQYECYTQIMESPPHGNHLGDQVLYVKAKSLYSPTYWSDGRALNSVGVGLL